MSVLSKEQQNRVHHSGLKKRNRAAAGNPVSGSFQALFRRKVRPGEQVIQAVIFASALLTIFITAGIIILLSNESIKFFITSKVSLLEFFTGTRWQPGISRFGILPLLNATLMTSVIAVCIAAPVGLFIAIYLSEYASAKVRAVLKPVLELLAGIPTVVYGYFALTFMTPLLRSIFGINVVDIYNTASAGIVIGILILPLVASISEDAINSVPRTLRNAAYSLGATKLETSLHVVIPAAFSGIMAAIILAFSRAIGETMIVALAAGAGSNFTMNPFKAAETMTGHIVRISGGDIGYDTVDYNSIFAIGLVLFLFTLGLNIISRQIIKRFKENYE